MRVGSLAGFLALFALGCGGATGDSYLDPVAAAPEHYFLELENGYVRVLRERLPAGSEVAMHSHLPRVSIYLRDSEVELTPRGGETTRAANVAGTASLGGAVTHSGRTNGDVENLSIELKELAGEPIPIPERDGTRVDPAHQVVELEDDRVRVLRVTYPAGSTSPMHEHLPGLEVALSGFVYTIEVEGGEPERVESGYGMTSWSDGGVAHSVLNDSQEDVVLLRVELKKRP